MMGPNIGIAWVALAAVMMVLPMKVAIEGEVMREETALMDVSWMPVELDV